LKNLPDSVRKWWSFALIGSLAGLSGWGLSRMSMVDLAILEDEYLYSLNARHPAPQGTRCIPVAGGVSVVGKFQRVITGDGHTLYDLVTRP